MAKAPANGPGPTTFTKIIAYTSSGTALKISQNIFPILDTIGKLFQSFLALNKDTGNASITPIQVPKNAISIVSNKRLKRS